MCRVCPSICTPALASAKSGTTTKLVQGCSSSWRRSFGDTARSTLSLVERASSGTGDWRKAFARTAACSTSSRRGGYTAMHTAIRTPAMAGWTPDSSIAAHSTAPTAKYAGPRHTFSRPSARITSTHAPAKRSGSTETWSE